jgi:putative NADH-flavin reductase
MSSTTSSTTDELLDEALRLTFPASDPIAVTPYKGRLRIVLFEGGGAIGKRIAAEAIARGHEVMLAGVITDAARVAAAVRGFDAVICAMDPTTESTQRAAMREASALTEGLARASVRRLLLVSETGALEGEALERYRAADLDWTYVSPAALPGTDPRADDVVAGAVLDELERSRHLRQRMSVS